LPILEFALSASVTEVRGAAVAGWSQTGGRVQVWFRKPAKEGSLEWIGSFTPNPPGKPLQVFAFEPPLPSPVGAKLVHQVVRVRTEESWAARVERDRGWTPAPMDERGWSFQASASQPPPRLQLFPPNLPRPARGFGLLELSNTEAIYRCKVEMPTAANRPHHLVLRASGLSAGAKATLDLPPGTVLHERSSTDALRIWDMDLPAGPAAHFQATLIVRFPTQAAAAIPIVDFSVGGAAPNPSGVVQALGVTGAKDGFRLDGALPSDLAAIQAEWPGEADRLRRAGGTIWSIAHGSPTLILTSIPSPMPREQAGTHRLAPADSFDSPAIESQSLYLHALAWCGAALGVGLLLVRFPRSTWPEQVGLLGGLFGVLTAGGLWLGLSIYVAARGIAAIEWLARGRR
jgi:hypothetical protein